MPNQGCYAFIEKYHKWCKRRGYNFSQYKAKDLYIESIGHFQVLPKNTNTKMLIREAATALNSVSKTAETFRAEMQRLAKLLPEYERCFLIAAVMAMRIND